MNLYSSIVAVIESINRSVNAKGKGDLLIMLVLMRIFESVFCVHFRDVLELTFELSQAL